MTGSIPFGNIAAPAGDGLEDLKHYFYLFLIEKSMTNHYSSCSSCSNSSSKPSLEPPITAAGHTLPPAVQPVQPTSVRTLSFG